MPKWLIGSDDGRFRIPPELLTDTGCSMTDYHVSFFRLTHSVHLFVDLFFMHYNACIIIYNYTNYTNFGLLDVQLEPFLIKKWNHNDSSSQRISNKIVRRRSRNRISDLNLEIWASHLTIVLDPNDVMSIWIWEIVPSDYGTTK